LRGCRNGCQCSVHAIDNWVDDVKEMYYWSARCLEEQVDKERAIGGYLRLLESEKKIKDEAFLNAVLDRLNLHILGWLKSHAFRREL